jgi:hydrogenase-4 component E
MMNELVIFLILAVLLQTRIMDLRRSVYCLAFQSGLLACACLIVGLVHGGVHLVPALLTLLIKVFFIPGAILRLIGKLTDEREIVSDINVNYSTLAAAFFLVIGYVLVDGVGAAAVSRDVIAASIFMILTGLSLMVMRKRAIMQMCGLITMENGIYLLGLFVTEGLPLIVELGVFLDVLIAVVVLVILTSRMSLSFMTTDTTVMKKLKG